MSLIGAFGYGIGAGIGIAPLGLPAGGGDVAVPLPEGKRPEATRPDEEAVAGGWPLAYPGVDAVLTQWADELHGLRGRDVFRQMAEGDPKVASALSVLVSAVLQGGFKVGAAVAAEPGEDLESDPDRRAQVETAEEVAGFIRWTFESMGFGPGGRSLDDWARAALEQGLVEGCDASEQVYAQVDGGEYAGKWRLRALKDKPRTVWAFVVDPYWDIVGYLACRPGKAGAGGGLLQAGSTVVLPPSKMMAWTWMRRHGDPRGRSHLKPAWRAYFHKLVTWPLYYNFERNTADQKLIGELPANPSQFAPTEGQAEADAGQTTALACSAGGNGRPQPIGPAGRMRLAMERLQNQSILVHANGGRVYAIPPAGDGTVFLKAFQFCDDQIVSTVLNATRTVQEAQHGSKADSETSSDVTGLLVALLKLLFCQAIRAQVIYQLVALNYGPDVADYYTPTLSLGGSDQADLSTVAAAIAQLFTAGQMAESQMAYYDHVLGAPIRKQGEKSAKDAMAEAAAPAVDPLVAAQAAPAAGQAPGGAGPPASGAEPDEDEAAGKADTDEDGD